MKTTGWLLLLLLTMGCTSKYKVPSSVIGKDQMQSILWDLIQVDQFSAQYLVKDSAHHNLQKETTILYARVLKVHNVSKDEFQKSYRFYMSRPDLTKLVFDSLAAWASRQRGDAYKKQLSPALNVR